VKLEFLDLLRCPVCRAEFDLERKGTSREVEAATLRCRGCAAAYPVERGIPRLVSASNYASNFGFQWNAFRATQLDSCSGQPISRARFFRQSGWTPDALRGRFVLDVGCGAGRFAEVALSCGANVVAVDYSTAVDACRLNLAGAGNLHVAQADIYALPFDPGRFDFVYCFGVLQHTPDVKAALLALPGQLRPGGEIAVDLYLRNLARWTHPRTWLRPLTTRLPGPLLFATIRRLAPALLTVSHLVGRVPFAGRLLQRLVPVANYERSLPLSATQLREWAILDTFDWLGPRYDQP
jgi:2-polyprenyl-3-methyl-5-hydroxy-6-metoxy-1,4-benzoquinol methylase